MNGPWRLSTTATVITSIPCVLRMVGDVQLAEDLSQEVFLRLWRRPDLYDVGRGRFLTWLLSVARNRAIDERRSRGRRYRFETPPSVNAEEMLETVPTSEERDLPRS